MTLGNKLLWNFNWHLNIFIKENAFENVIWKMAAILSRPQCVNIHLFISTKTAHIPEVFFSSCVFFDYQQFSYKVLLLRQIIQSDEVSRLVMVLPWLILFPSLPGNHERKGVQNHKWRQRQVFLFLLLYHWIPCVSKVSWATLSKWLQEKQDHKLSMKYEQHHP